MNLSVLNQLHPRVEAGRHDVKCIVGHRHTAAFKSFCNICAMHSLPPRNARFRQASIALDLQEPTIS